jgi:hypothetical protein
MVVTDPGDSDRATERIDFDVDDPTLRALLQGLDAQVALDPLAAEPEDIVTLSVLVGGADGNYALRYSPASGIVQLPISRGQFQAPEEFRARMEALLSAE